MMPREVKLHSNFSSVAVLVNMSARFSLVPTFNTWTLPSQELHAQSDIEPIYAFFFYDIPDPVALAEWVSWEEETSDLDLLLK
jgi:hypothetical protein